VALEHADAMKKLWSDDVASFEGRHVSFRPSASFPKPVQRPGPPVLLGAPSSERNMERVIAHADGWIPMGPNVLFDDALAPALGALRSRWVGAAAFERAAELRIERVIVHVGEADVAGSLALLDRLAPAVPA
jgi:alkanesulfonate monooxygenase SsuD/methylene tetrahydromethanopterin reductase-like flavin-dependent oxidoreductase (luciferase family)